MLKSNRCCASNWILHQKKNLRKKIFEIIFQLHRRSESISQTHGARGWYSPRALFYGRNGKMARSRVAIPLNWPSIPVVTFPPASIGWL